MIFWHFLIGLSKKAKKCKNRQNGGFLPLLAFFDSPIKNVKNQSCSTLKSSLFFFLKLYSKINFWPLFVTIRIKKLAINSATVSLIPLLLWFHEILFYFLFSSSNSKKHHNRWIISCQEITHGYCQSAKWPRGGWV